MDLDSIFQVVTNFFSQHTYIAFGLLVALVVITYWRPKQMLRVFLVLLGAIIAGYILYLLGDITLGGFNAKKNMISQ